MKAIDLINAFNDYVKSNPRNKLNRYPSFKKKDKFLRILGDMEWDKVAVNQKELNERLKQNWEGRKEPSPRSLQLSWIGLAYCYEYGVEKKMIPNNPLKNFLPQNPQSGSYIDR